MPVDIHFGFEPVKHAGGEPGSGPLVAVRSVEDAWEVVEAYRKRCRPWG